MCSYTDIRFGYLITRRISITTLACANYLKVSTLSTFSWATGDLWHLTFSHLLPQCPDLQNTTTQGAVLVHDIIQTAGPNSGRNHCPSAFVDDEHSMLCSQLQLDVRYCLAGIEVLRASLAAVHKRLAAVHLECIIKEL